MTETEQSWAERPRTSKLENDPDAWDKEAKDKHVKLMEENLSRSLREQGVPNKEVASVSSFQVYQAIKHGYVIPGWKLIDYIRSTWQGFETDPPSPLCVCGAFIGKDDANWESHLALPGEHARKPRRRFHLVNVWGEQGSSKSSFVAQMLGLVHGGYAQGVSQGEWQEAWDWSQKVTITNREDLKAVAELAEKPGQRFDVVYFDDLNSIIGKQLAWEDRQLYKATFEMLGMIRRVTGAIITSAPNIEMVIGAFNRVMTFECIVYPNSSFKVERMCHDIHPYYWATDKVTKIMIEEDRFDPYDTPLYFWKPYEERTNSVGHGSFRKVVERMNELDAEGEGQGGKDAAKAVHKAFTNTDVREIVKELGLKASGEKLQELTKRLKERAAQRLKLPENETSEIS